MADEQRLALFQTDIGLLQCAEQQEIFLRSILSSAVAFLTKRGVTPVDGDCNDDLLVASVAAWMYRSRTKGDQSGLPRYLDIQIKDRICAEKMRGAT